MGPVSERTWSGRCSSPCSAGAGVEREDGPVASRHRAAAGTGHRVDVDVDVEPFLDEAAVAALEALYASLPALACWGLCAHSYS